MGSLSAPEGPERRGQKRTAHLLSGANEASSSSRFLPSCPRVGPRFCCEHLPRGAADPRGSLRSAALAGGYCLTPSPKHCRAAKGRGDVLAPLHPQAQLPPGGGGGEGKGDPRLALQRRQSSVSVSHSRYKSVRKAEAARGCSGRWRQSCKPNTQETLQPGSSRSSG